MLLTNFANTDLNMKKTYNASNFDKGLAKLGFYSSDDSLFLTEENGILPDPQIAFHIERAKEFKASAVYLRRQLNGSYKAQAYLYDYTGRKFEENELTNIQKIIWSSGDAPLACVFYDTEIKVLDCTTHIKDDNTPVYLVKNLQVLGKVHALYNEQFAIKIKSGLFWEAEENRNKFKFQNSSYDKLIDNIKFITQELKRNNPNAADSYINKIIIQSILIKYLEERIDDDGNKLLSNKFFRKYDKANTFADVLRKQGKFVELLSDLNDPIRGFNGNVFEWKDDEKKKLSNIDLTILSELLENNTNLKTGQRELWRYFEFKYIPVELISRLYEEFLGVEKRDKGLYYTPSHLAKLLVDEAIPLQNYKEIALDTYNILDPACGSGIFLVIAFKRLVQIWRLQNNMALPELPVLKKLLQNIYGVDKEEQAVRLASFSLCLAICNELKPIDIINKLKFDDLSETNLFNADFFSCNQLSERRFDLIIGNPPFNRGITENTDVCEFQEEKVKVPQGQIALSFLAKGVAYLKPAGLQCLIIKASGLLYNSTSFEFKRILFSKLNVVQILDFTALARNKALWDNGADVASAAIFLKNEAPNFRKNLLHLTFRRTKATKERITFEIDDYDLHFVNRHTAIHNQYIWKNNLLGGGRIRNVVDKFVDTPVLETHLSNLQMVASEGFIVGTKGTKKPPFAYKLKTLPTEAIDEDRIDYSQLVEISKSTRFNNIADETIFTAPNILVWANIGKSRLPVFFNEKRSFTFRAKVIGISSVTKNKSLLKKVANSLSVHSDFYRFFIYVTSGQLLINLNTTILKDDLMQVPFLDDNIKLSKIDLKIISDVNTYSQDFLRHGENSIAVAKIPTNIYKTELANYGREFSSILNATFKSGEKRFHLAHVVNLDQNFIATVFQYDDNEAKTEFHADNTKLKLEALTTHKLSESLSINRIVKIYSQKDTIIFVKPNQTRYWLSITAYRDADKCFADLTKLGY